MITNEQREARKLGIGGSDMAVILGLSNYKTPYQLYLEKKGLIPESDEMSQLQYWGNRLESVIREEFSRRHNIYVEELDTVIHPFHDFLRANVDGFVREWNAVFEAKCSTQFMAAQWGEDGSDIVPMAYLVQVAHYCSVLNCEKAFICVLIGGHDYREFTYTRDLRLEEKIIETAKSFWHGVQNNEPPAPVNQLDLNLMFPSHTPEKKMAIADNVARHLTVLAETRTKIRELESVEGQCRFNIMGYMKDAECLMDESGKPLVTWKANKKGTRTFLLKGV